jgi:caspase domain-containing protein
MMIRALAICVLTAASACAAESGKALLIGVEGYESLRPLRFVGEDVRRLAESFSDRCGFEVTQVIDTSVTDELSQVGPTTHRDALMTAIENWVAGMHETDTAILYFSAHGVLADDGKLYLASLNCRADDPVPGGVPMEWLREQLSKCPARRKLLLLDACHAGSSKAADDSQATAKAVEAEMSQLADVATLASCMGEQQSFLWDEKGHSLYTYWLTEAAKGHADTDDDGRVSIQELTQFVERNVSRTAKTLGFEQTPTLLGSPEIESLALTPKPISLKRLILDMAEQVDTRMRQKDYSAVGIPEFSSDERGDTLQITYGTVPVYIANQLTDELAQLADGDYEVISGPSLHQELSRQGVSAANIETATPRDLRVAGVPVETLALGRISGRSGATFTLGCKLKKPGSPSQIGSANGVCFLNDSEWAMLGRSAGRDPGATSAPTGALVSEVMAERISELDQAAQRPHPHIDPAFPFRVEIRVKGADGEYRLREGMVRGNDYFVPLKRGEVYCICIHNRVTARQGAFLRLLVDGLNTLPEVQKASHKGVTVEVREGEGELTIAPRVNLAEARPWYLDPAEVASDGTITPTTYCIRGFLQEPAGVDEESPDGWEFIVKDAPESAAARKGYTDQIGLITAALYLPKKPRAVGTGLGDGYRQRTEYYRGGLLPGDMIGVINIRYDEP